MKVAILGLSDSRSEAPSEGWEKWGLAWDGDAFSLDRVFEMHDVRDLKTRPDWGQYAERLQNLGSVYMQTAEVPGSVKFPFDEVARMGRPYWTSSVAYMLSLAILEATEEIGIWGVDARVENDYGDQRPCIEYWLGIAQAMGLKVSIHESSDLLKFSAKYGHINRYGWLG